MARLSLSVSFCHRSDIIVELAEDEPVGTFVTRLSGSDVDNFYHDLTWTKTLGDPLNHFNLNPGVDQYENTITTNVALDRETTNM